MMPMTPRGTETLVIVSPLGRLDPLRIRPTGSGSPATWRMPLAICSRRSWVKSRRSKSDSRKPALRPSSISTALASRMVFSSASSPSAILSRIAFFTRVSKMPSSREAFLAASPWVRTIPTSYMVSAPFTGPPGCPGG